MYPFNVIWWVRVMMVACLMSLCIGATFVGTRWRFWDSQWQRNITPLHTQKVSIRIQLQTFNEKMEEFVSP
jgi:hypothetical protein